MAQTGRPRKNIAYLSITLPREQDIWLRYTAKLLGIPVSHLIATLIDPHVRLCRLSGAFPATEKDSDVPPRIEEDETRETG